jgi:hypothetical protein
MLLDAFMMTTQDIAIACETWGMYLMFTGEKCQYCGRTANVVFGMSEMVCACGNITWLPMNEPFPLYPEPDLGPSIATILQGHNKSSRYKKWVNVLISKAHAVTKKETN